MRERDERGDRAAAKTLDGNAMALQRDGYLHLDARFSSPHAAFAAADAVLRPLAAAQGLGGWPILGEFVLPPADGPPSRNFQTLHFDFGLPLHPVVPNDVGRYTVLHVPAERRAVRAMTRLVRLDRLLAHRRWPAKGELLRRFERYGASHGAWDIGAGYVEGSLARVVEAAIGSDRVFPSVSAEPGFMCGTEFDSLYSEHQFFHARGLPLAELETDVHVQPGAVLIFDNLVQAHGRRGTRAPGELHQRVYGHHSLSVGEQRRLRDVVLHAFAR